MTRLSAGDTWHRLQHPLRPDLRKAVHNGWMDEVLESVFYTNALFFHHKCSIIQHKISMDKGYLNRGPFNWNMTTFIRQCKGLVANLGEYCYWKPKASFRSVCLTIMEDLKEGDVHQVIRQQSIHVGNIEAQLPGRFEI